MPTQASQHDANVNAVNAASHPSGPRRREGLRTRTLGDDVVILDREREQVHQLNATAAFIWNQCDGSRTTRDLARALAQAYANIDPSRIDRDVATALRQLQDLGLLEGATGAL